MNKKQVKLIALSSLLFVGLIVLFTAVKIVDEGERAVVTKTGQYERTLSPGLHFVNPFFDNVYRFETRTQKYEVQAHSASRDLQTVQTTIVVNFNLNGEAVSEIYRDVQTEYMERIVLPAVQDTVKASTALFNAEALITRRAEVKDEIHDRLAERLERRNITVSDVSIVDFQFAESFDNAIEAKVVAEQRALEAENKLRQSEFEAQQRIEQARGEAEAIRIQAQAITQQGGRDYVQLVAIEKWDGKLPQNFVPGSTLPFLNLNQY